jgi:hypothetical protein
MNQIKGSILCEQAYAQGKMLNNSGWTTILRGNTFADLDCCILLDGDPIQPQQCQMNNKMVLVELSSKVCMWQSLNRRQMKSYKFLVENGQGKIVALLGQHNVPKDQQIDTTKDIIQFSVMKLDKDGQLIMSEAFDGKIFPQAVKLYLGVK